MREQVGAPELRIRSASSPGGPTKGFIDNEASKPEKAKKTKKQPKGLEKVPVQDLTENRRVIIESTTVDNPVLASPRSRVGRVVRVKVLNPKMLIKGQKGDKFKYIHKVIVDFEPLREDGTWSGAVYTRKINYGTLIQPIAAAV